MRKHLLFAVLLTVSRFAVAQQMPTSDHDADYQARLDRLNADAKVKREASDIRRAEDAAATAAAANIPPVVNAVFPVGEGALKVSIPQYIYKYEGRAVDPNDLMQAVATRHAVKSRFIDREGKEVAPVEGFGPPMAEPKN